MPATPDQVRLVRAHPTAFLLQHWLSWAGAAALVQLVFDVVVPRLAFPTPMQLFFALTWGLFMAVWHRRRVRQLAETSTTAE